jgi:arylsulfatase A-like enzyme
MKILKPAIAFPLIPIIFYLFSLFFNASLTFMGVDLSNYGWDLIKKYSSVILLINLKVLILTVSYYAILGNVFYFFNRSILYSLIFEFLVVIVLFFKRITITPQIYSDFFYFRHPSLEKILDFICMHSNPNFWNLILVFIFLSNLLLFLKDKHQSKNSILGGLILLIFLILDYSGFYYGIIILYSYIIFLNHFSWNHDLKVATLGFILVVFFSLHAHLGWSSPKNEGTPIILISSDSLRPDKITEDTKAMRALLQTSTEYKDHHTTIPRTFPSWTDLLTGRYAMSHKIRDMFPDSSEVNRINTPEFPTIPAVLNQNGYHSYVVSNFAGDIFPRAPFGFSEVEAPEFNAFSISFQKIMDIHIFSVPIYTSTLLGGYYVDDSVYGLSNFGESHNLIRKIKNRLNRRPSDQIFLVYFSSTAHFPYNPPYPYYKKGLNNLYKGKYKYLKYVDPTASEKPNEEDIKAIQRLYDNSIQAFDGEVSEIIEYLKNNDLFEKSMIILTSDHGEALYEGELGHGHGEHLRGEYVTNIPLFIKYPNQKVPKSLSTITSSVDLFPTILDELKLPKNNQLVGVGLKELETNPSRFMDRVVYSETGIWFSDKGDFFFQKQRIPYPSIIEMHEVIPEENFRVMIRNQYFRDTIAFSKHRAVLNQDFKLIYIPTREGVLWEFYSRKDKNGETNLSFHPQREILKKRLYELSIQNENAKIISDYILPPPLE